MRGIWLLLLMGVFVLSGCFEQTAPPDKRVGETIELTLDNAYYDVGTQFDEPSEDKVFLVLELTIENNGSTTFNAYSTLMFELESDEGTVYDADAFILSDLTRIDGSLDAGERKTGHVPFSVSLDDEKWALIFTPYINTGESYTIELDASNVQ